MAKKVKKPKILLTLDMSKARQLAYGENRDQSPAFIAPIKGLKDPLSMHRFTVKSGKPSYISIADGHHVTTVLRLIASASRKINDGTIPYIAVVGKHGNPCGVGIDWDYPESAITKAMLGNPVACMGGELVVNFFVNNNIGENIFYVPDTISIGRSKWGMDIILAPDFSKGAIDLLGKREKRRLLKNPRLENPSLSPDEWLVSVIGGSALIQKASRFILTPDSVDFWSGPDLTENNFMSLIIAFAACYKSSSNTVALAKDNMLIGLGAGQQDRIECVRLCINRANIAGHDTKGSVFASDAFFPYPKGDLLSIEEMFSELKIMSHLKDMPDDPRKFLRGLDALRAKIAKLDKREGPELLIDAGCIGGVVPGDGKELENVKQLFAAANVSVAFLNKIHRGFAKHA